MNNRRTFGARYAAGGGAGMNRGGGRAPQAAPLNRMAPSNPIGMAQNKMMPPGGKQQGGGGGGGGGGGRMPQRIENLQNRLENRREKIQNLKGQLNAARQQAPLQQNVVPPGQAGGSTSAPPPASDNMSGNTAVQQPPTTGASNQSPQFRPDPRQYMMNQAMLSGMYNPPGGYDDMGAQQDMVARDRSIYGRPIGGDMGGYGDNMYGDQGSYGQDMGGYDEYSPNAQQMDYGQQGGYGQNMGYGQQMNQQNVQQQSEDYIPRRSWSSQQEDQQYKTTFGTLPGEKNYVQKMENYYKQQGFPFPEGLRKHFEKEQAYALNAMGQTPPKQSGQMTKDIKPGMSKRPPARTKDIRPGTKKQAPVRGKAQARPGMAGGKKATVMGKTRQAPAKKGGSARGGKRFAAGGVVPRPAAARPMAAPNRPMPASNAMRKASPGAPMSNANSKVGAAPRPGMKGGGLARKGVGMALKSGGMVRGAGCAQRGRGKAK